MTDRWLIARRYLCGFFAVDVISVFPGELLLMLIERHGRTVIRSSKGPKFKRVSEAGACFASARGEARKAGLSFISLASCASRLVRLGRLFKLKRLQLDLRVWGI